MKLAVITGCDSGIGKSLVPRFIKTGYKVILSYLDHNPFKEHPDIISSKLDLRSSEDIDSFATLVNTLVNKGNRLEYVINNAGIALGGPFENLPISIYRQVMEVNLFGMILLTQKLLPGLIRNRGRLIINGSMAGRIALPFLSPYTASKFAIEGWCDSIRRELNPLGITTILIEPGGIATPIWNKALEQDSSFIDKKYSESINAFRNKFIRAGAMGMDTEKATAHIFKQITCRRPQNRYIIASSRMLSYLETLIPGRILDRIVAKMFSMKYHGIS
ncbi:MAG: SDR family NAD(P)-dependent oxidoreductase [Spirochaetes bacterium]|nr:SDR family NAD(P)-dependent oxidoreductase [Spirochaetota bacterium]